VPRHAGAVQDRFAELCQFGNGYGRHELSG
jgi:hypothetical protein